MVEALVVIVALVVGLVTACLVSLPFIVLGTRSARQQPARAKRRALPWSIGAGLTCGFVLAASGFLFGAGIGDESAGAIAVALFTLGSVVGFVLGAPLTFFVVVARAKA